MEIRISSELEAKLARSAQQQGRETEPTHVISLRKMLTSYEPRLNDALSACPRRWK